jgi:aminoglycoside 3-N-acetyltransferase
MKQLLKKIIPSFLKDWIKSALKKKKFQTFKKKSTLLDFKTLEICFRDAGVEKGDVVFVHSSLKGLGYIEHGAKDVVEALKSVVTSEGTLVFPTFTIEDSMYNTLKNPDFIFDPKTTPSTVGAITNYFHNSEGTYRSIHPTHSVSAWGKHARYITQEHYETGSNFGKGTPFGKMLELNGKIMGIGISYGPVTIYHAYEDLDLSKFPGVYLPQPLSTRIRLEDKKLINCNIFCHTPEYHKSRIDKTPEIESFFAKEFEKNISHKSKIGDGYVWWMKTQELFGELDRLYKEGRTIYQI